MDVPKPKQLEGAGNTPRPGHVSARPRRAAAGAEPASAHALRHLGGQRQKKEASETEPEPMDALMPLSPEEEM